MYLLFGGAHELGVYLSAQQLPPYLLFEIFLFWFTEETAWRGFALPRLQARTSALVASLLLGLYWGLWHTPLFLIPDSFQSTLPYVGFVISAIATSVLATWIFNHTRGSVLLAAIFHGATDATIAYANVMSASRTLFWLFVAVLCLAAIVIVVVEGPAHLARKQALAETTYPVRFDDVTGLCRISHQVMFVAVPCARTGQQLAPFYRHLLHGQGYTSGMFLPPHSIRFIIERSRIVVHVAIWLLRVIHILGAIIWAGWSFSFFWFMQPAINEAGQAGGAVMARCSKGPLLTAMIVAPVLAVLAGLIMYFWFFGASLGSYVLSFRGALLTIGAIAGLAAFGEGAAVVGPTTRKLRDLERRNGKGGGPPDRRHMGTMAELRLRLQRSSTRSVYFFLVAIIGMALGGTLFYGL